MRIWEQLASRVAWTTARLRGKRHRIARASKLFRSDDPDFAQQYLQDSLRIFPDEPGLLLIRAQQLQLQGDTARAIEDVIAATDAKQAGVAELFQGAQLFESLKRFELSRSVCQRLTKHECHRVRAHSYYLLAKLHVESNQTAALKFVTQSICLDDHTPACSLLYSIHWRDRDAMCESLGLLQEAAKVEKRNEHLHMAVADLAMKFGEFDVGVSHVKSAARKRIERIPKLKNLLGNYDPDAAPMKPSFLIIGAMKCGTSSLHNYIHQHPNCIAPIRKEIRFFENEQFPLDWYLSHFPPSQNDSQLITGEASPGYYCRDTQYRVKTLFPNIKLICILRNPVQRTISQFHHVRNKLRPMASMKQLIENIDSFRELNEVDDDRAEELLLERMKSKNDARISLSFYYYFLRRWSRYFPKEQLLILSLKDLKQEPDATMRRVYEYLDLDAKFECNIKIKNRGKYAIPTAEEEQAKHLLTDLFQDSLSKLESEFDIELGDI